MIHDTIHSKKSSTFRKVLEVSNLLLVTCSFRLLNFLVQWSSLAIYIILFILRLWLRSSVNFLYFLNFSPTLQWNFFGLLIYTSRLPNKIHLPPCIFLFSISFLLTSLSQTSLCKACSSSLCSGFPVLPKCSFLRPLYLGNMAKGNHQ